MFLIHTHTQTNKHIEKLVRKAIMSQSKVFFFHIPNLTQSILILYIILMIKKAKQFRQ